ncbi:hypothetical protein ABZ554_00860 [Streptomyces sp. NPDC020125]|uniref:hypothetical protein n=1 Tax=Streptomyces sp. NPDC020125 TaxID=3154593 RepID=UPI0033D37E7F
MARVVVVQVGEQARLGGREVLAYLVEAGASGVGEEDLACAAVAGVGSAGDQFAGAWSPDVFAEDDSFIPEPPWSASARPPRTPSWPPPTTACARWSSAPVRSGAPATTATCR